MNNELCADLYLAVRVCVQNVSQPGGVAGVLFFDDPLIFSCVVLLVIFIGMFGITQLPVFYAHREILETKKHPDPPSFDEFEPPAEDNEGDVVRYAKSGLKEPEATDLHKRRPKEMEEKAL